MTAIFLATGVTIGTVIGTITNALKKLGTDLGNGLKTAGAKAASALPGLIGAIVSFLLKAAGNAIGFLLAFDFGGGCISFPKIDEKALTRRHKQQSNYTNHANNYRSFVYFVLF